MRGSAATLEEGQTEVKATRSSRSLALHEEASNMAIVVEFNVPGMTAAEYDTVLSRLESKGVGSPDGRVYHVAAPSSGGWFVVDVWESQEQFDRFGEVLIPTLQAAGVTPATPEVRPVHNIITG